MSAPYRQTTLSGSDEDGNRKFIIQMNEQGKIEITKMVQQDGKTVVSHVEVLDGTVDFLLVHKTLGLNFKQCNEQGKYVSV